MPGLTRCKNLWTFSLFRTFCFPRFYCVDFFVSILLCHSWVLQVVTPFEPICLLFSLLLLLLFLILSFIDCVKKFQSVNLGMLQFNPLEIKASKEWQLCLVCFVWCLNNVLVAFKKSCLQLYMAGVHKIAETERFYFYNHNFV